MAILCCDTTKSDSKTIGFLVPNIEGIVSIAKIVENVEQKEFFGSGLSWEQREKLTDFILNLFEEKQ